MIHRQVRPEMATYKAIYEDRRTALHQAERGMYDAAERCFMQLVTEIFPTATRVDLWGEYGEDGELHISIEHVDAPAGSTNTDEGLTLLEDESVEYLLFMASTSGEDLLGKTTLDLTATDPASPA